MANRELSDRAHDTGSESWVQMAPIRRLAERPANRADDRTFMVLAGGLCIPVDGALHIESIDGAFYVVGHSTWEQCDSQQAARRILSERVREIDPHDVAAGALDSINARVLAEDSN